VQAKTAIYTQTMKISHKLFFSFLGLTSLILIATLSLARWSFEQGFLDFIKGMEKERLQRISVQLVEEYQDSENSWEQIKQLGLMDFIDGPNKRKRPPPRGKDRPPRGQHPRSQPPAPNRLEPTGRKSMRGAPPTALFDVNGEWVSGFTNHKEQDPTNQMEIYAQGQLIGQLQSWAEPEQASSLASEFSRQQLFTSLTIGFFCLLIASIISLLLSRVLLGPLRRVLTSVAELSKGNYQVKFAESRNDELGKLMQDVEYLSDTLEKNRSAKNRWFADISHELRTPLTVLSGEIEAMKAGIRPLDQKQLMSLDQEVMLLRHLVDDLYQLSLSDMGGLRYNFASIDLKDSIQNALESMRQSMKDKGLRLELNLKGNLTFNADAKRIEQLFTNLSANSMAYTDAPGEIHIESHRLDEQLVIEVHDSKPSVSVQECSKLFEPLYRVDQARTRRNSGAGLGLIICKNIVEAHKGTISASPSPLGGLCIKIVFESH
jgi:two-component system sensor histidine kinase BaeS